MMKWILLALLLCTIEVSPSVIYDKCPTTQRVTLGDETAKIVYKGDDRDKYCYWTLPVKGDYEAVVLQLENVTLPYAGGGCAGELRFPDAKSYSCHLQPHDCWIYTAEDKGCELNDIKTRLSLTNPKCNRTEYWKNLESSVVVAYHAANYDGHNKKFTISYYPVSCAPPTTAAPTTTSSTTVITMPSTSGVSTTKQTSTTKSNENSTTPNVAANISETGSFTTTGPASSAITQPQKSDSTTIIAVIIPITVVLLLVIGVLVFLRHSRQKKEAISKQRQDGMDRTGEDTREMVVNEIYGDTNIDRGPEVVESQIYEQSDGFALQTTKPDVYAVVIEKKPRKETQSDELHGESKDAPDNDNDKAGDVYAVIQKHKK